MKSWKKRRQWDIHRGLKDALDECRMVMACHGAMRANQALTEKQIEKPAPATG